MLRVYLSRKKNRSKLIINGSNLKFSLYNDVNLNYKLILWTKKSIYVQNIVLFLMSNKKIDFYFLTKSTKT